jgi:hypothetical protein
MAGKPTTDAALSRRDIEQKIVALAWKDDGFRRDFLADPKAQFESHLQVKLAPALKIEAHQEDENHLHFVIPAKPKADLDELSDADLEKVAGGVDVLVTGALVAVGIGLAVGGGASAAVSVIKTTEQHGWAK